MTDAIEVRSPFALRCGLSTMHLRAPNQAAEPVLSKKGLVAIASSSEALAFRLTAIGHRSLRQTKLSIS